MARLKYSDGSTPLLNEHNGFTFQPNAYGQSALSSQKNDRFRNVRQSQRQQVLERCIREWRDMSVATKQNWADFAAAYPQPTKSDPDVFLTGYQLFLKRNSYCLLNEGTRNDLILEPVLEELPDPDFAIRITQENNVIDFTDLYVRNFGLLPAAGQFVICKVLPYSAESGQFFVPFVATIEVENVYVDGLFGSFEFTGSVSGLVFSVYLSKPVWESVQYPGTKYRYMGCFKPTTFKELTDTPNTYAGQAGKVPIVTEEEDGLEFVDPGGGGNAFNPIQVDGQDDITAEQAAEPLTIVAGSNVSLTTDDEAKSLTISASGGGGATPNWGTLRQVSNSSSFVSQYLLTGILIDDDTVSLDMTVEIRNDDGTLFDYMLVRLFGYYRGGSVGYSADIIRPFDTPGVLILQQLDADQGFYRYLIIYNGSLINHPSLLAFSWFQRSSIFTHHWDIPH